jgi:hypothetical protein
MFEILKPKIIISNPKRKEIKTIKMASSDEKPMYLKAFVNIKYNKYNIIMGIMIYKIHKPICVKSVKANITNH